MDDAVKAVSPMVPVLASIAVKLIDKLISEDNAKVPRAIPQIIQVSVPVQCNCRCRNRMKFVSSNENGELNIFNSTTETTEYDDTTSCSTCRGDSTTFKNSKRYLNAPTTAKMRSSSTSDKKTSSSAGIEKLKTSSSSRSLNDIRAPTESKKSLNDDTLAILAHRLSKEIKDETGKKKTLSVSKTCQETNSNKKETMSQYKNIRGTKENTKTTKCCCNNISKTTSSLKSSLSSSKSTITKSSNELKSISSKKIYN